MQKCWALIPFILLAPFLANAQQSFGLKFDDDQYTHTKGKATLMRGDFFPLPPSASLKEYCPKPLSQRMENTSTGWASAYGARTILEAKRRGITDKIKIREISFSPVFNYAMAKGDNKLDCSESMRLPDVLESMKIHGIPFYKDFRKSCPHVFPQSVLYKAAENRINDFYRIFDLDDDPKIKIEKVKRSLSKETPVVIGMYATKSFELLKDVFWVPRETVDPESQPGHSVVVIGYDDSKYGAGAFEIMNSWGTGWANGGFAWIRYSDFTDFVKYGFEMFIFPFSNPDAIDLAGEIEVELKNKIKMEFTLTDESSGYYISKRSYTDDDSFQLLVSSRESAFVYVIGSDDNEDIFMLFPDPEIGTSAALPYKNSHVKLPSEFGTWELDGVPGNGYLAIIFSKEELWPDMIEKQLTAIKGKSFSEKLKTVFANQMIKDENITYSSEGVIFEGKTKGRVLTAMVLEIKHSE